MTTKPDDYICPEFFEALSDGLTKREYFAAKALAGLCTDKQLVIAEQAAPMSRIIADQLINELNK